MSKVSFEIVKHEDRLFFNGVQSSFVRIMANKFSRTCNARPYFWKID